MSQTHCPLSLIGVWLACTMTGVSLTALTPAVMICCMPIIYLVLSARRKSTLLSLPLFSHGFWSIWWDSNLKYHLLMFGTWGFSRYSWVVFLTFENGPHKHTDASWKICCWRWTAFCDLMAGQFSGMRWKSWMWYKRLWSRCTGMSNKWTQRRARRSLLCRRDFGDRMLHLRKWA